MALSPTCIQVVEAFEAHLSLENAELRSTGHTLAWRGRRLAIRHPEWVDIYSGAIKHQAGLAGLDEVREWWGYCGLADFLDSGRVPVLASGSPSEEE